jgi:hypothetical protein
MNRDGKPDLVSVRLDVYQPFSNDGRAVLWLNRWGHERERAGRRRPEHSVAGLLRKPVT